jgi:acetylornithine deacetylase/succinyl-diaminopimelate desuccinylase-like protein
MDFDLLQLARDLVAADSVSARGTARPVAILRPLYEKLGWSVRIDEGPESAGQVRHQNLLAVAPGGSGSGLLGVTHLDTVDPGPRTAWSSDPFTLTGSEERLVGLGAADVKIDAACKLIGFSRLRGTTLTRPLAFLGTFQEEVGCKGARHFTAAPPFHAQYVLCGEPSELRIIDAHKGYAVVRVTIADRAPKRLPGPFRQLHITGKAAHSSTPHLGENAILKGWPYLQSVAQVEAGSVANKVAAELHALLDDPAAPDDARHASADAWQLDEALHLARGLWDDWQRAAAESAPAPNPRFSPAECVVNWGALKNDGPNLSLFFDARLLPGQSPSALLGPFEKSAAARATARHAVEVQVDRCNEAMALPRPSALLDAAQQTSRALGLDPAPQAKPTNTEAGIFASAGAESIVFGPGVSTGNAHCANEFQLLSQCRRAIDFYEALARTLCTRP